MLAALPPSMCHQILQQYTGKNSRVGKNGCKISNEEDDIAVGGHGSRNNVADSTARGGRVERGSGAKMERSECANAALKARKKRRLEEEAEKIVVKDQKVFLASWKKYVSKMSASPASVPTEKDAEVTGEYLSRLARTNLEVTELCLKSFRGLIQLQTVQNRLSREQCAMNAWISVFNSVLKQVQAKIAEYYGGTLRIEPLSAKH